LAERGMDSGCAAMELIYTATRHIGQDAVPNELDENRNSSFE
jgi:hypothetical protein